MSQSGSYFNSTGPIGTVISLTGNSGGPVPPTLGNINIIGAGFINVVGDAATSTLTIESTGSAADQFDADSGTAVPVGGVLNIVGSSNIHTAASGNTVEVILDDNVAISGSFTAGTTAGFITAVTGDISADAGNFNLPTTLSTGDEGVITINGNPFIQNFAGNVFLGTNAGNFTLTSGTAINNTVVGNSALNAVTTGHNNTVLGLDAMLIATTASINTAIGANSLIGVLSGQGNTALGAASGANYLSSESSNIVIGNPGVTSDNNTIRIGAQGSSLLEQNLCFIAGIIGNTVSNAEFVTIDSVTGQLGVTAGGGAGTTTFDTDSGTATESGGAITIAGGSNINTSGAGSTVTINLDNTVSISGSFTAGTTAGFITAQTGDISTIAGNFNMPGTTATSGIINMIGSPFAHVGLFASSPSNSFFGFGSGLNSLITTNNFNTGMGMAALPSLTTGQSNTCIAFHAGSNITSSNNNSSLGTGALGFLSTGTGNNTAIGVSALSSITTGSYNTGLGMNAGASYVTGSESSNIVIGNGGVNGESNVIRIGIQGTGNAQQSTCYIAGITGATVTGSAVLCSTAGQLGTIPSSIQFKENIQDISTKSEDILSLRPVVFNYKDDESKKMHYGLIAEEVLKIFPDLVLYDNNGEPASVAYHELPSLLLNELKKTNNALKQLENKFNDLLNKVLERE